MDRFHGDEVDDVVTHTFHNCWFTSIGKTYNSSDYVIRVYRDHKKTKYM